MAMNPDNYSQKNPLFATTNSEYGSPWLSDSKHSVLSDIRKETVPTYAEIVDAANDFRRAQRLIKNRVFEEKIAKSVQKDANMTGQTAAMISTQSSLKSIERQYPVKAQQFKYPQHGLKVGSAIYRTSNMNYGSILPNDTELPNKYFPQVSTFSKGFTGNYKFHGLNTAKTVSNVHDYLNQM